MIGNKDDKFVEDRKKFLQYFCDKLAELKYLYYNDESRVFFRSKSTGEIDKILSQINKHKLEEIITKYKSEFSFLSGK